MGKRIRTVTLTASGIRVWNKYNPNQLVDQHSKLVTDGSQSDGKVCVQMSTPAGRRVAWVKPADIR